MKKVIVTTLCMVMFATTTLLPTKAEAVTLIEYALLVGSVRVESAIIGVGANITDFEFNAFPLAGNNAIKGIIFCRNKGGTVAPGANPVIVQILDETSSSTQLLENGKVFATSTLGLNADDLQQFIDACPNGN